MELTIQVDLVSLGLELLVDPVEVLDLEHEVRDIVHVALQVSDRLGEPLKHEHCAVLGHCGDKLLDFVHEELWCRCQV